MNTKKFGKYGMLGIALICVSALITSGAVFTYLWSGSITANAGVLVEYSLDDITYVNAEDYTRNLVTSDLVSGETETLADDYWRISSDLDAGYSVNLDFTFTQDAGNPADMTGISMYYYFDDGTTNTTVYSCVDGTETFNDITGLVGGDSGTLFC